MKSRFKLDRAVSFPTPEKRMESEVVDAESTQPRSMDPASYDASERYFATGLDKSIEGSSRFVVEALQPAAGTESYRMPGWREKSSSAPDADTRPAGQPGDLKPSDQIEFLGFSDPQLKQPKPESENSWRREVSARLTRYQAGRRPREHRYPSLQLKFETQEASRDHPSGADPGPGFRSGPSALARSVAAIDPARREVPLPPPAPDAESVPRIIEFPRSANAPQSHSEELAEAVFDRPRIMEAPDIVSPPATLGGILIAPREAPSNEKRPGFEMPLQPAPMARRLAATLIDALIVVVGLALAVCIFWRVTALVPPVRLSAAIMLIAATMLWAGYQYLLIVHCGVTPGLQVAKLQLSHFDGNPVFRRMRRWRVLASILSGLSLGMGYAWCFLDEDQLCWHDRITHTYIAPKTGA